MIAAQFSRINRYEFSTQALASLSAMAPPKRRKTHATSPARGGFCDSLAARIKAWASAAAPWLALAAILTGATAAIAAREGLGAPSNFDRLSIEDVRATASRQSGGNQELVVTGEIVNLRDGETPVPILRLVLRGEEGRELYRWTNRSPKSRLAPHERVAFKARLAAPPGGARDVLVKFVQAGDKASFAE